jgi:phosphoglucosamine mutase
LDLRGLKIVVDCAHGAAYHIAPDVFHELGAEVIAIGNQPNGFNINDKYGATEPAALSAAVKEHAADIGIALDGDADRLLMVDASGRIYNGDELLYVMVKDRHANGGLEGAVGTLMTNMAIETAFKKMGVGFARAKVGDRYVLEVLQERGWHIGGEGSGHLLFLDKHTTGDGIVSALQVLSALQRSQQTLAESTADMSLWPQTLINVKVPAGFDWQKNTKLMQAKEQADKKLANDGRVLIRASGTEPLIRVMVEARDAELARTLAEEIAAQV